MEPKAPRRETAPKPIALFGGVSVVLTTVGYLLLLLCALSVYLFCWLAYSSLTGAARPEGDASEEPLAHRACDLSARIIGAGSG
jgi:threonine/homoserine/homoserine lactone efflux protein